NRKPMPRAATGVPTFIMRHLGGPVPRGTAWHEDHDCIGRISSDGVRRSAQYLPPSDPSGECGPPRARAHQGDKCTAGTAGLRSAPHHEGLDVETGISAPQVAARGET